MTSDKKTGLGLDDIFAIAEQEARAQLARDEAREKLRRARMTPEERFVEDRAKEEAREARYAALEAAEARGEEDEEDGDEDEDEDLDEGED